MLSVIIHIKCLAAYLLILSVIIHLLILRVEHLIHIKCYKCINIKCYH